MEDGNREMLFFVLVEMHLLIFFFFFFAKENVINSIMFGNKFRYILGNCYFKRVYIFNIQ